MGLTVGNKVNTALSVTGDSYTGTDTVTTNTDNSRAYSALDYSQGKLGSTVSLGEAQGSTINLLDAGAIQGAINLAEYGIQATARGAQAQTDSALASTERAIDLAKVSQQGQGGTLINGLIWIVGLLAGAAGIYFLTKPKKKAAANA